VQASGLQPAAFLQQPGADLVWGRALYPRYLRAGNGLVEDQEEWLENLPFHRTIFRMLGPGVNMLGIFPGAPVQFPHAADVLVLGCHTAQYFHVAAVVFLDGDAPAQVSKNAA